MVEIRYGDYYEVAELAGQSITDARQQFRAELCIPGKARAKLNGKKVDAKLESEISLCDDDKLSFAAAGGKGAYLAGALLLALAVTGGVFAYGYITASTTLSVTASGEDFASVTANTTNTPGWTPHGFFKGSTGNGTLFNVDTATSGFDGDLVISVSIANADELVEVYRVLALFLELRDWNGNLEDVNGDGSVSAANDYVLLTLSNGTVDMFVDQLGGADNYTVHLKSGFFATHVKGGGWGLAKETPQLYAEVAQRGT